MTTPPITPPALTPPPSGPDPFDKALALAKEFTNREISSVDRSFNRFTSLIRWQGVIALGILAFFGWRTISEVRSQVKDSVAQQMPLLVQAEVAKQFAPDNVQRIAEKILATEVRTDIEKAVDERVTKEVADQVAKQAPLIQHQVDDRTKAIMVELRPQIDKAVDDQAKTMVAERLAPRHVTQQTKDLLKAKLPKDAGRHYIQVWSDIDPERMQYAKELVAAFNSLGWEGKAIPTNSVMNVYGVYGGVLTMAGFPDHKPAGTAQLKSALAAIGMETYDSAGGCQVEGVTECWNLYVWQKAP